MKPIEQNESTEAIHTIEAPNLTLKSYEADKLKLLKKERQVISCCIIVEHAVSF